MKLTDLIPPPEYLMMRGVGIDVSDRSIKFVEFEKNKSYLRLKKFGEEILEEGIIINGEIKKKEELVSFLKKIRQVRGFTHVVFSLPEEKAFLSLVELPKMSEEEIKISLSFQIEQYVPLKKENIIFDFEITSSSLKSDHFDVLLLAFPKNIVYDYYEVFERAGFAPIAIELESLSLARSLVPEDNKENILIIDFGKTRTTFSVLRGHSLRFTSTVPLGGRDLEKLIARAMGVNPFEAEKIKKDFSLTGLKKKGGIYEAILPILSSLEDEIRKHQDYWQNHLLHQSKEKSGIKEIILAGGDANLSGLPEYLSQRLLIPARLGNPWIKVGSFEDYVPEIRKSESLAYSVAIGLALRGFQGE